MAVFIGVDDEDLDKDPGEFFSLFPSGLKGSIGIFFGRDWRKSM